MIARLCAAAVICLSLNGCALVFLGMVANAGGATHEHNPGQRAGLPAVNSSRASTGAVLVTVRTKTSANPALLPPMPKARGAVLRGIARGYSQDPVTWASRLPPDCTPRRNGS